MTKNAILTLTMLAAGSAHAEFGAPMREVDVPAKSAIAGTCWLSLSVAGLTGTRLDVPCTLRDTTNQLLSAVPAGKVLVIEYVNTSCSTPPSNAVAGLTLRTTFGGDNYLQFPVNNTALLAGSQRHATSGSVRVYAAPGTTVRGYLHRESASQSQTYCDIKFWGHLVTLQP